MISKSRAKDVVCVMGLIMLSINCLNTYKIKEEIHTLKNEKRNIEMTIKDLEKHVTEGDNEIKELLKEEQSIFSHTSVDIALKNNKFVVTMQAVPKELKGGEKIIAKVIANGKEYEKEVDENNRAVMEVEIANTIKPIFIIKSDTDIKQEALKKKHTSEIFTDLVSSEWVEDEEDASKMRLDAWINGDFKEEDIVSAKFIVVDSGVVLEANESYSSHFEGEGPMELPKSEIEGTIMPAEKITSEEEMKIGYSGDFSKYMLEGKGIVYNVYFSITKKDGMQYTTPYGPIATYSCVGGFKNMSVGEERLMPILTEGNE